MNPQARLQLELLIALAEGLAMTRDLQVAFRGGACLRMCHGSPRSSEDLNFLAVGTLAKLDALMLAAARHASAKMLALGFNLVRLAAPGAELEVPGLEHFRCYHLVMPGAGPELPCTRVTVEFMGVPAPMLEPYSRELRTPMLEELRASAAAELWSGSLETFEADKIVALALRRSPQACDVFDLGWIGHQRAGTPRSIQALEVSRCLYDNVPDVSSILKLARERLEQVTAQGMCQELADLLPSTLKPAYAESLRTEARSMLEQFQKLLPLEDCHAERA